MGAREARKRLGARWRKQKQRSVGSALVHYGRVAFAVAVRGG